MPLTAMTDHHDFRPAPLSTPAIARLAERRRFLKGLFPAGPRSGCPNPSTGTGHPPAAPCRTWRLFV